MLDRQKIVDALEKHWKIGPAAKELGVAYSTLRLYIKSYGIKHDSRRSRPGTEFNRTKHQAKKVSKFRQDRKVALLEYKGGTKCSRCGFNEPIADCYAFHHRDPSKKDPNWGRMINNNVPVQKLHQEVDKCDVLCHNCHHIVHYLLRQE